jgi:type II secretion system protein J
MMRFVSSRSPRSAFTLIELVLAMAMAALLALALYGAMSAAIRARRSADAAVEPTRAVSIAADMIHQDLESVPPPTGILAGPFQGTHSTGPRGDNDDLTFYSLGTDAQDADSPLAEGIRKIELAVNTDVNPPALVRRVTRNLLASSDPIINEEVICRDVQAFSVRYYDGTTWQEDWDSTTLGDVLPMSVSITIELADPTNAQPGASLRRATRVIPMSCAKLLDTASSSTGGLP